MRPPVHARTLLKPALLQVPTPALGKIIPSVAGKPSGCRPAARPVEFCPKARAFPSRKRQIRSWERIAGPKSVPEWQSARQFAVYTEFSPDFLPSPIFPCATE
jgi:hypothetical protein